ncbi:putative phage abortive infection protein [Flavobacterium psychrotrophum]|uniref:putative phage abortive infection protein n=1 Tax=Flavobacterium psychrotrophum TaxID=2294119 RepID=UPI000E31FC3C|nr:putative phage abortive infection protein [Flavobacterium psychrotrophum]
MKILILICSIIFILSIFSTFNKAVSKYIFRAYHKRTDFLILGIVTASSATIIYSLVTVNHFIENPDFNDDGKIEYLGTLGDLVGGLVNPAIAIPATLLTFLAFWVQYKANDEVRKQFDVQKFETELNLKITILRQEITEISLPAINKKDYSGREVMYQLDKELKFIYFIVKNTSSITDSQKILSLSYYIFFKGRLLFLKNINHLSLRYNVSRKQLLDIEQVISKIYTTFKFDTKNILKDVSNEENTLDQISLLKKALKDEFKIGDLFDEFADYKIVYYLFSDIFNYNLHHFPFKGHETKLSLFFRQIFNIVKFVNNVDYFTYEQKRGYLRTLRGLLSNYDQLQIFYNWYSDTATKWEDKDNKFLTDFRMIHNIPLDFLIEDLKLDDIFSNRSFKFESGRRSSDSLFENIDIFSNRV